jgi:hypothetical protein
LGLCPKHSIDDSAICAALNRRLKNSLDTTVAANEDRAMRAIRKESLRKWVSVLVPALSLFLAGLMGPIAFTLKSTVKDLVRQELAGNETIASSATSETNDHKLMLELGNRLSSIESKLELLMEAQRKLQNSHGDP